MDEAREPLGRRRAICVLGMHSSGTSLTAGILGRLGVDFGPPGVAAPARRVNTRGLWEHLQISRISDSVLRELGGSWDEPPKLPLGWEGDPSLDRLRDSARTLLDELFGESELWGWKNPRNSLLLPFWRSVLPDTELACAVCIRDPAEVVASLGEREGFTTGKTLRLWRLYTLEALSHSDGLPRMICRYSAYWEGRDQVRRLASLADLGGDIGEAELERLLGDWIDEEMWRHRSPGDSPPAEVADEVALYRQLCELR